MAATRICLHLPFIIINRNEDGDFPIIPFKQVRKWEGERRTPVFSSCLWHDMCVAVYGPMQPRLTCAQAARAGSVAALTCLRMYGKINGKTFWNTQALLACSACLSLHCVQGKDKQFEKAVIGWFKKRNENAHLVITSRNWTVKLTGLIIWCARWHSCREDARVYTKTTFQRGHRTFQDLLVKGCIVKSKTCRTKPYLWLRSIVA